MSIFVLDTNKKPQNPVHPAKARLLLTEGKASVFSQFPFTIMRQYLLEKWDRQCAYCRKTDTPLEIEHIVPKSKGGSNRVSNLTLACTACNRKKGNKSLEQFLSRKPGLLKKIQINYYKEDGNSSPELKTQGVPCRIL